jgi:hypothetical protein
LLDLKIYKQFENNIEIYNLYFDRNKRFFNENYKNSILQSLNNNEIENAIILLLKMLNFLMNFYTIGRIFKTSVCNNNKYCPDPTFIICYFGKNHTDDIKNFLKEKLNFEEVFNIDNSNVPEIGSIPIIYIENLQQPLFSDVNI